MRLCLRDATGLLSECTLRGHGLTGPIVGYDLIRSFGKVVRGAHRLGDSQPHPQTAATSRSGVCASTRL